MSADPLGASRARAAGPGGNLALGRVVTGVEYDIVGERAERFAQRRAAVTSLEDVRADVASFAWVNPDITWHVIERTTTTVETLADHLLAPPSPAGGAS